MDMVEVVVEEEFVVVVVVLVVVVVPPACWEVGKELVGGWLLSGWQKMRLKSRIVVCIAPKTI
jgi:hypothetical protein